MLGTSNPRRSACLVSTRLPFLQLAVCRFVSCVHASLHELLTRLAGRERAEDIPGASCRPLLHVTTLSASVGPLWSGADDIPHGQRSRRRRCSSMAGFALRKGTSKVWLSLLLPLSWTEALLRTSNGDRIGGTSDQERSVSRRTSHTSQSLCAATASLMKARNTCSKLPSVDSAHTSGMRMLKTDACCSRSCGESGCSSTASGFNRSQAGLRWPFSEV